MPRLREANQEYSANTGKSYVSSFSFKKKNIFGSPFLIIPAKAS